MVKYGSPVVLAVKSADMNPPPLTTAVVDVKRLQM
jgi:hypothetical protein